LPRRRHRRPGVLSWGYAIFRSLLRPRIEALLVLLSPFAVWPRFSGPGPGYSPRTRLSRCQHDPGDHPPIDSHSPSEFDRPSLPPEMTTLSGRQHGRPPLMRFVPLQRLRHPGAYLTRACHTRYVPPSGFPPSRRFASPRPRRPYFMPATLLGFSLQSLSLGKDPASSSDVR